MLPTDRTVAYGIKAAELFALAKDNRCVSLKREFEHLACAYLRLIREGGHFDSFVAR